MSRPRIDDLDGPPVLRRTYLVPTVRYEWNGRVDDWPVMGPRHEDGEHLSFPWWHYHLDPRFMTAAQWRRARRTPWAKKGAAAVQSHPLLKWADPRMQDGIPHPDPVWRPLRCLRVMPEYLFGDIGPVIRLNAAYAGRRCPRDAAGRLVCPHKGADLSTLAPDGDGLITCPLHGLRIDPARGVVAGGS